MLLLTLQTRPSGGSAAVRAGWSFEPVVQVDLGAFAEVGAEAAFAAQASALRQMQGLPSEAIDMLVRTLARICDDPYDLVFSAPVPPVPVRRVADLG
jgi:hypothetical protein